MRTAVITGVREVDVRTYETPEVEDDKILVHLEACGICTWEQRIYNGNIDAPYPLIGGHETAGYITAVGKHVQGDWEIGQRVVVGVTLPCRECYFCKIHEEQSCLHFDTTKKLSGQPLEGPGGFSEYMMVSPLSIFPYEHVDAIQACMCEPLSCVVHSVESVNPQLSDYVVVIGAGIMGLLHTQLCVKKGCVVIVVDMNEERLQMARDMGAHYTINPEKEDSENKIVKITKGIKAQAVFDTTPIASLVEDSCRYVGNTGKLMIYSGIYPNKPVQLNAHWIHKESIQIMGTANSNDRDFMRAIRLIDEGIVDVLPFISGVWPIEQVKEALESSCRGSTFRNIITFDKQGGNSRC